MFLDELGDLPLLLQAKLLRAIESREITRVGGLRSHSVDVRFVAATNRDLGEEVASSRFRRDLYYRLNCVMLNVPPLRDRPSEIVPLAQHFLASACLRFRRLEMDFSAGAIAVLMAHAWPGNVREIRNVVERAALMADGQVIGAGDLFFAEPTPATGGDVKDYIHKAISPVTPASRDPEQAIADALAQCAGNQTQAAKVLGMPRRTLVRKLAKMGIRRSRRGG